MEADSTMKRLAWGIARGIEALAWSLFFVFAAAVLALRFWILPDIERFRPDIVAAVSGTLGRPVDIGAIEAGWYGMRPQVTLFDVRVLDEGGREALVLPVIENVVSWRSLLFRELRLHSLAIDRPHLDIRRDRRGELYVAGMKIGAGGGEGGLADWVLGQEEIIIRNAEIEWHDERRGAPPLALSGVQFRLRSGGAEHAFGLSAQPPAALGASLEVRGQLEGRSFTEVSGWSGRVFVELGATRLASWRQWVDYPVDLREGEGALRFWATLRQGEPQRATLDVELSQVAGSLGPGLRPLSLARVSGRLQLASREGGYELVARHLAFASRAGETPAPTDLRLLWRPAKDASPAHGSLQATFLDLEPLAQLAESLPFPEEPRRLLASLSPRGRLQDARFEWDGPPEAPARYTARARFADLGLNAHGPLPGFSGLSGSLEATESKGAIQLASSGTRLDLPRVLTQPQLALDTLSGQVNWERKGSALAVQIASLGFANPHAAGKASGTWLGDGSGPGVLDLTAQLSRADGRFAPRYLPLPAVVGPKTHAWLTRAILAGQSSDVRLRLKGNLKDFPFVDRSTGTFQVIAQLQKGALDYGEGWPPLQDIDATLLFERDRMEITGRSASVLGARLSGVKVQLTGLAPKVPSRLTVNGQADGPTSEFLRYIASSPVRRMVSGMTDDLEATGRGRLRLGLEFDLDDLDRTRVTGEYELFANNVTVSPMLPPLERATGKASFTESGFSLNDVRARLLGGNLSLTGGSRPGGGTEIVARGEAAMSALQPVFDHPLRRYLSGTAPYTATIAVQEGRARYTVESNLRGVTSTLPVPLAKGPNDPLPLRLDMYPAEGGARDRLAIAAGRVLRAEILRRKQGGAMVVQRAGLALSPAEDQAVRLPERPGVLVQGSLAALDLDRWMPLLSEEAGGEASAVSLDVRFGTLDAWGKRLQDVAVRAGSDAAGWSATVQAAEIAGDLSYRSEKGGQLVARLKHFTVPEDAPGARARAPGETRDLPSIDLVTERFAFRGKQFGRVELVAQHAADAWRIDRIYVVNTESWLSGRGVWQTAPSSATTLRFDLETGDAGKFLARLGYPDLVAGGKARMQGNIAWAGDPTRLDFPSLSGELQMQAENGQFLEIEPGIGKLVSLMSLQALPRRLTLDFRDVFSKGFQFDRIASSGAIEKGIMHLKDFRMKGSAADVEMTGDVDLARETQQLQVRVVPNLGDSASTVLGLINPLLVFPAAIAQRILKDPLGHIFAFDYSITGSWADPKVARTRVNAESSATEQK